MEVSIPPALESSSATTIDSQNAKEMDTSSDPEEVNVDMNSPKQEPVDAEAFQMERTATSSPITSSAPSLSATSSPMSSHGNFQPQRNVPSGSYQQQAVSELLNAKERRRHFLNSSMTPTFNTIRETCELKRQTSDPIKFSPLDPHLSRLSDRLPKQHSDPHPIDTRATMQSHLLQRLLQRDSDGEEFFKVTCGIIEAKLIWKLFRCPGISQKCIRMSNGEMITPKDLVKSAGKQTLKDWKRAIRINNTMLRKHMSEEGGGLDYYLHDQHCSNTCKSSKTMSDISMGNSVGSNPSMGSSSTSTSFDDPTVRPLSLANQQSFKRGSFERSSSEDSGDLLSHTDDDQASEASCQTFWQGLNSQADVSGDIFGAVMHKIQEIQLRMRSNPTPSPSDAVAMTKILDNLGMMSSVQERLRGVSQQLADQDNHVKQSSKDLQMKLEQQKRQELDIKTKKRAIEEALNAAPITKKPKTRPLVRQLPRQKAIDASRNAYSPQRLQPYSHIMPLGPEYSRIDPRLSGWHPHLFVSLPYTTPSSRFPPESAPPLALSSSQSPIPPPIEEVLPNRFDEKCTIRSSPDHTIRSISPAAERQ
ncbi:Oidioi.mRNA.OKI2018_I69.chr2.g7277.t1.cds [Oikopleura dioica]|uniref:Oidioi.mRNA.OKI2018_I69.chr2.g7277.t1.cds n=1 Tax=Oikopleura dioica TaxID=34765 RepID=A0ABN7TCK5_OIKDI|nr:Oidioi.mRNA.OKI2018_I69.chr2.g7277.t1.cds [Oikopleura dioica]